MKEAELLDQAIKAFRQETGVRIKVRERAKKLGHRRVDAVVELQGETCVTYFVAIKKWVAQRHLGTLVDQMMQLPKPRLLVADYINQKLAKRLKDRGIQYIDTMGNTFIDHAPIYINVRGNERKATPVTFEHRAQYRLEADPERHQLDQEKPATGRAFTATGLKVVYALLKDPELTKATYREIAHKADVALGTVGWVVNDLKTQGLIFERGKNKRIGDYQKLLQQWVDGYALKLRPKLLLGNFVHDDPNWWHNTDIRELDGKWGGEIAAAKMTGYLKPACTTIYLRGELTRLIQRVRLRTGIITNGVKVEILKPFWPDWEVEEIVDPIVVYADLVQTADPRNLETAQLVFDDYIYKRIGKNR